MEKLIFLLGKSIRASLIMGCMMFLADLKAQNIVYEYDASRNRIKRSFAFPA